MKLAMALAITATSVCATTAMAQMLTEQVIPVPGFADFLAVDGDTVWATNRGRVEHWSREGKLASVPVTRPCGAMTIAGFLRCRTTSSRRNWQSGPRMSRSRAAPWPP